MIRAGLDSNILVYAELEPETEKGRRAQRLIALCAPQGVIAVQALLEFIAVVRRRRPQSLGSALAKVESWSEVFETAPTTRGVSVIALNLVRDHKFQVWDAVIWTALAQSGASIFFTEDLQDGFTQDSMRAMNPFLTSDAELEKLFRD